MLCNAQLSWNSIRQGGPAHGIGTKTVHKTLPGVVGCGNCGWGSRSVGMGESKDDGVGDLWCLGMGFLGVI